MLQRCLRKITKLWSSDGKKYRIIVLTATVFCCLLGVVGLSYKNADGYTLGSKGSAIVPGTKSGNAEIWPVTHPVFIVRLYDSNKGMGTEKNAYNNMADSIKTVIPYADENAMWLCSNKASSYLIDKKFKEDEEVYLARKTSLASTELHLIGGANNKDVTGRIKYLSVNEYKEWGEDIENGVFYGQLLKLYVKNNRSMAALSKDSDFKKLLKEPDGKLKKYSMELWSYITEVNAKGSDSEGWEYKVDIKYRIDKFLHAPEAVDRGLNFNNWSETSTKEVKMDGETLAIGDSFDLRYLDLLMTLNAISNNSEYWKKGINSFMLDNVGAANLSITQAIIARMNCASTKDGDVKPATVFVSCNDLTQGAYGVKESYNLSGLASSKVVYDEANDTDYIKRLKAAVSLSKSKTYNSSSIYSSAIISRVISERVRSAENNKLVWGSSNNPLYLIKFLQMEFGKKTWMGANWVLEPPTTSSGVKYQAFLTVNSTDYNKVKKKNADSYGKENKDIDLYKYYEDREIRQQKTVITQDKVNLRLTLNAIPLADGNANDDWKTFIKKNNISTFRVRVELSCKEGGTDFKEIPLDNRKFVQNRITGEEWCTSTEWQEITKDSLYTLLQGKTPIAQWEDKNIEKMEVEAETNKKVIYIARVYIQYKASNGKWYYTTGKLDDTPKNSAIKTGTETKTAEEILTNEVKLTYYWKADEKLKDLDYPTASWASEEPALAYAELKEGSIYNETFEAMAGVPSTRTLYFSSGGNEFMVDLRVDYEHDATATREYISHYDGTECEYKTNDQLKGGTGTYTKDETFVGDSGGRTISKSVPAESSKIAEPEGNPSKNITVNGHTGETVLWARWDGSIGNGTGEPADSGKFDPGKPGSPCAGLGFDVGTLRTKEEPSTDWNVSKYNEALEQAVRWAQSMENTNSTYTVQKIADSDGQIRQYQVGNAVITITLEGGDNSYVHTTPRSYSGGAYTSSSALGAKLNSSDKKLGSGWGWSDGKLGSGGGYEAGNHGHGGVCPGNDHLVTAATKTSPAVYGPCGSVHNCGYYTPGTDITQGASGEIRYSIKVTFQNGTLKAMNYDGNGSDVSITTRTGLDRIPAHALCGPCCDHDLPAVEDVWYQDTVYDTIKITKCNVYKIQKGYVTGMGEITNDSSENLVAGITHGDPNIFYNIAASNTPLYQDGKITNASGIGRIRYSLQEAQGDKVYYEEMSKGEKKRTNKCDGLCTMQDAQNPAPLAKKGHELGFAAGILYSNGKTSGYGSAPGLSITTEDFVSDNKATTPTPKTAYGNRLDSKDLLTDEWKRFYTRRTQEVTATVISDMLILQTSSGDQSPVYYAENTKAEAQKDFPSLQASGDVKKPSTQEQVDAKWKKMWDENGTTFAKTIPNAINVGSYNGKYNLPATKYQGSGKGERISTRFDQDSSVFASAKDELGLADVRSSQSFTKPSNDATNLSSPGKGQARMDRLSDLIICIDKIKQKPTNENREYETGESFLFYLPILKYKMPDPPKEIVDAFQEEESEVLAEAGYHYGAGLLYKSGYSAYGENVDDKVNNIVTLNAVSTQNAMIIKSKVEDQRTQGGIVKDAMETLKALEKCPGTPALCEYRYLSCKYTLDTTSLSFRFEDEISGGQVQAPEEKDIYAPFTGQLVTSSIKNTDGALPTYEVPEGMTVTAGDGVYAGFGTGQFLKITGAGTRLQFPYSDCKVYRTSSSRVSISADVYLPAQPKADTMLFSIGGVGLQVPANASSPVLLTSTGQRRAAAADIIGKKVKIVVTFSLGSLYDCELAVDGTKVLDSITDGLTDAQISAAAVGEEMRGSGVNIGCWEDSNSCATDFYVDNLVVTRCGGSLKHTASCYTTFKKEKSFYQDTYNGLRDGSSTIDWTREADDGKSYGVITSFSKHVHDSSCLTLDSRGYQIALAQAKAGDWTNLKKELGTTLFDKVVQSFGIDTAGGSAGDYKKGDVLTYQYTGGAQSVTLPKGRYKLEAYGAQGGNDSQIGGNGGYAQGTLSLSNTATLYLQAGGQGVSATGGGGGYNGGGNAGNIGSSGGGGGASSIATVNGALSSILQNPTIKDSVLLVAGGGGGAGNNQTVTSDTPSTLTYTGNTSYTTREGSVAKSFTASGNGSVVFYSNDFTSDPYGFIYVYDSNGALRSSISNDDSGGNLNFSCSATVYQGDTVVFYAGAYSREGSCNWTIQYTVSRTTITYAVGAGGTGGGAAGGNGGEVYLASYNGLGGSSASYYAFGQGESHSGDGGGGGGGYYGGFAAKGDAGAGGGSGYTASRLTETSNSNGINSGNGRIVITVIEANRFPDENELFNYMKANMSLIPDTVTTGGKTITNPIWNCKLVNNAEKVYTEETLLTCTEPHHSGGHYDYSSDICWSACGRDENHKSTHQEVTDANGSKIEQAEYITLDNFFQVYFPNTGDFYGDGSYGISDTSINRGKGYVQGMDTTEWTREKYVKFDFEVLYERNGVWENHSAGEWIPLEVIDRSTTRNYSLSGGTTLILNGNTYMFDMARQLLTYNNRSTTLVEGGTMAVVDGKIFQWNGDGTVSVSDPCKEYNFYCLLSNNELSSTEVQYAVEGINYDGQSADETPYAGDGDYQEEFDIYRYGNTYNTNKQRFSDFTSNHTAAQLGYLDVVGRIGNFIVEDTDDMRFSNFFKKPVVETNDDWYIEGIISQVDSSISQNYLSWHRNSAGYPLALDVRGEPVGEKTGYYNTWGTQEWTVKAGSGSMGLSADKNNKKILQDEQLKLGYNVLFDITTMGDYNQYLQVIPYFYALDRKTSELIPVDVYISEDGSTKPINYFGLYSEYMDESGNYKDGYSELADSLYRYNMYLNWTNEAARRNYKTSGREAQVSDRVRDYFIEDIRGTDGEITGYKYLTVPYGNFYNMGTLQCLQPGRRARTFVGNSMVTAIQEQAARLGITANGINGGIETNLNDSVPEMFYRQAQRWHLTMGLPSSAAFTAYREKGIHVKPEEEWYTADYVQDGIAKTKTFSEPYLSSSVGKKSYGIGSAFTIAGVQYTINGKYNAGKEFNNNNDYVILMTADIKAIGDVWNLKYKTGDDNGNVTVGGRTYQFGSSIPTFIAAYDTVSSLVDISTQQTH